MNDPVLELNAVGKCFTLHHRDGARLEVLRGASLSVRAGECVVLDGPSGTGKSTLLKMIYANYGTDTGHILVRRPNGQSVAIHAAAPRTLAALRRDGIGYVSQFLRVIPRVSALEVVAEPLLESNGDDPLAQAAARAEAAQWLNRLRIPPQLWSLPPATFSGGEQQRINIARNLIRPRPLLLLDEPTASLDAVNTQTVIELIREATARGAAVLGIFHDRAVGDAVATRRVDIGTFKGQA